MTVYIQQNRKVRKRQKKKRKKIKLRSWKLNFTFQQKKNSQIFSQIDEGDEITSQRLLYNPKDYIRPADIHIIWGIL